MTEELATTATLEVPAETEYRRWQRRVFVVLWITYASYYLCRLNMSVSQKAVMEDLGVTPSSFGWVLTAMSVAYGCGQLVCGQLCDRVGGRLLASVGMFGSAAANLLFAAANSLGAMTCLWAANGLFQSMGFSACVKTLANWFPVKERGRISGWFSLSYKVGNAIAWLFAGYLAQEYGWRYAFAAPALILIASGVHFLVRTRNSPEEVGLPTVEAMANGGKGAENGPSEDHYLGFSYTLSRTFLNPRLWCAAISGLLLAVANYGFLFWLPTYLGGDGDQLATAARSMVYPLAGCIGAVACGWASDRLFASRRAPPIVLMMVAGGALTILYPLLAREQMWANLALLGAMGVLQMGAHAHIVTSIAMDFGTRKAAASATGFIDAMGYVGAAITGAGSGWIIDEMGWDTGFRFWGICAIAGAAVLLPLWKTRGGEGKYQ